MSRNRTPSRFTFRLRIIVGATLTAGLLASAVSAPVSAAEPPTSAVVGVVYWQQSNTPIATLTVSPATWDAGDAVQMTLDYTLPKTYANCYNPAIYEPSPAYFGGSTLRVGWDIQNNLPRWLSHSPHLEYEESEQVSYAYAPVGAEPGTGEFFIWSDEGSRFRDTALPPGTYTATSIAPFGSAEGRPYAYVGANEATSDCTVHQTSNYSRPVETPVQDAAFTINPVLDSEPGRRWFHANDKTGLHEWDFGDGATDDGFQPEHFYEKPGAYTVTHCRPADLLPRACTSQQVEVEATELQVGIHLVDELGEPLGDDPIVKVGDELTVRVRVSAGTNGVGDLHAVTPVHATGVIGGDPVLELAEPADLPESFDLARGESRDFLYRYTVVQAGRFELGTAFAGLDAADRPTGEVEAGLAESIAGLSVTVEIEYASGDDDGGGPAEFDADNNGDGVVTDADNVVTVKVTAENLLEEAVRDVRTVDDDEPVDFRNLVLGEGAAAIETMIDEPTVLDFGDLEPGESSVLRVSYQATQAVHAEAWVQLAGVADTLGHARGVGSAEVSLQSDLALEVTIDMEERPYTSGQVVRLRGTLENLLQDRQLPDGTTEEAVPITAFLEPILEGNAGNGYVTTAAGSATPLDSDPIVVLPGETVTFSAILVTLPQAVATEASVRYLVRAWQHPDADAPPETLASEIDPSRVLEVEGGEFSAEHSTALAAIDPEPDAAQECETTIKDAIVTCNLWVGLRSFGYGIAGLGELVVSGSGQAITGVDRLSRWSLWMMKQSLRTMTDDPQARQALAQELEVQLATWVEARVMSSEALDAVGNATVEFFQEGERVFEEGDVDAMLAFTARTAGENPDLLLGGFAKLRALNAVARAGIAEADGLAAVERIRQANEVAAATTQEQLLASFRAELQANRDPLTSGVLKGAEDFTGLEEVYQQLGYRAEDADHLLQIAQSENVLIASRSRSTWTQKWLDLGALLKPQDVKTKTVNIIDTTYLGYSDEALGRVELMEPPIDFRLAAAGREAELAAAVDDYMAQLGGLHPELGADAVWFDEVRARLVQRTKEFGKELPNYERYATDGIRLEFGYAEQGLPSTLDEGVAELRKAQVTETTVTDRFGRNRARFQLKMRDTAGDYQWITGDIDIVGILNLDGTPITDLVKRKRVYQQLQQLLGIQHGETMTYVNAEVQAKLLRDHVAGADGAEALSVAGPDGRFRFGFLEEQFSTAPGVAVTDGMSSTTSSTFQLISGAPREWVTPLGGVAAQIASWEQTWNRLQSTAGYLLPGKIADQVDGLEDDQVDGEFDRNAPPVRADGRGGLQVYVPAGGAAQHGSSLPTHLPTLDSLLAAAVSVGIAADGPTVPERGAAGGTWQPISLERALALYGDPQRLELALSTSLPDGGAAGDGRIEITSADRLAMDGDTSWFQEGDIVVIDPGGDAEERATVIGIGSLILAQPLRFDHPAGTAVIKLAPSQVPDTVLPGGGLARAPIAAPGTGAPGGGGISGSGRGDLPATGMAGDALLLAALMAMLGMFAGAVALRRARTRQGAAD